MMTLDDLKQFCDDDDKYSLGTPHIYVHPETQKEYTFATDGHRMVIVDGRIDGVESSGGPNISSFIMEPTGVEVDCTSLKAFLECDKPTTKKCVECGGKGRVLHDCNCGRCDFTGTEECGCGGKPSRITNRGWLGIVPFNRALLADPMKDVADSTVLVHIARASECIHVFTSDRHICVMPMTSDGRFKDAPQFTVQRNTHA